MTLGKQFRIEDWNVTVDFFDRIFRLTTPYNLLNIMPIYNKLKEINTDKKTFSELKVQNFTIKAQILRLKIRMIAYFTLPDRVKFFHLAVAVIKATTAFRLFISL